MTYKAKFDASQDRAHHQLVATKILEKLGELRANADSSQMASRRWVWELIQNAKDVHPEGGVKIQIELGAGPGDPHVTFRHNGRPFFADDIRFLIEQISTKDRTKNEDGRRPTTGKFGTGFLTTHLLSEVVYITGVAKEPDLPHTRFELKLDRSSDDVEGIIAAVQRAKRSVEDLDVRPPCVDYVEGALNTVFRYPLQDKLSVAAAEVGLRDLDRCLPYSLIFVEEIDVVEVHPGKRFFRAPGSLRALGDGVSLVSVTAIEAGSKRSFTFARLTEGLTSIVVPVEEQSGSIALLPIGDDIPRLFCDFPLLGTEKFPFQVIINNPSFNPTEPRDGVYLTTPSRAFPQSEENKPFLRAAVELYLQLLRHAVNNRWQNLHLLAQAPGGATFKWLDSEWLKRDVSDPIRKRLMREKIVTTASGTLASMLSDDGTPYVWFPYGASSELRDKIWLCASVWFPHCLPSRADVELWYKLAWDYGRLTLNQLAAFVERKKTLAGFAKDLGQRREVFEWLNGFYALLRSCDADYDTITSKLAIFPNQKGEFCRKFQLYRDAGDIGDDFKDILTLLRRDFRAELVADEVVDEFETPRVRDRAFAVKEIIAEVDQKITDREVAKAFRPAFGRILLYFQKEPKLAKALFPTLYQHKHWLYDDEEIASNINKAEQLAGLLTEFRVSDVAELRAMIARGADTKNSLLPVTQEIIASMGITTMEEWVKALEDKDLAALFSHESVPTLDMFVLAQSLIKKAREKIINHLKTLPHYDLSQMDQTAPTILAGILKNEQSINVVARPGYGGYVIIYYGSERDVLDYMLSELWVDPGDHAEPRQVTLGHILKKAQIQKFPI